MQLAFLCPGRKAISATPILFSRSSAHNVTARACSARSSVFSHSRQSKRLLSMSSPCRDYDANRLYDQLFKSSPHQYDPNQFYDPKAEEVIRATNQIHCRTRWGFVTCRCTYKSQAKWDQFMSRIKNDARKYLKDDPDLFESMDWPIIEDLKLDDVHYAIAARQFGEWVRNSLSEQEKSIAIPPLDVKGPEGWQPQMDPRHEAFIYATEDVVNSVLDYPEGNQDSQTKGGFVYLVNYNEIRLREEHSNKEIIDMLARRDAGESLPGDGQIADLIDWENEDTDLNDSSDQWRTLRIKLRACYLVSGYATVEDQRGWDYGFDEPVGGDISEPANY